MLSFTMSLFTIIFWLIRVVVAFTASMNIEFLLTPLNLQTEIILTFITLISIILIFKRSMIGALIYLISHAIILLVFLFQNNQFPLLQLIYPS